MDQSCSVAWTKLSRFIDFQIGRSIGLRKVLRWDVGTQICFHSSQILRGFKSMLAFPCAIVRGKGSWVASNLLWNGLWILSLVGCFLFILIKLGMDGHCVKLFLPLNSCPRREQLEKTVQWFVRISYIAKMQVFPYNMEKQLSSHSLVVRPCYDKIKESAR